MVVCCVEKCSISVDMYRIISHPGEYIAGVSQDIVYYADLFYCCTNSGEHNLRRFGIVANDFYYCNRICMFRDVVPFRE